MRSSADFSRFCFVGVVVATFFMPLNGYCMMLIVPLSSQTISRRRVDNILVNHGSSLSSSSFAFAKSKRPDRSSYNHRRSTSQGTTTYLALESPTPPSASADADIKPDASEETAPTTPSSSLDVPPVLASLTNNINGSNNTKATTTTRVPKNQSSKRAMLGFAIPALGIYLANPLLSNIDNAFVGQTVGTAGLAALSPATICTDQLLYLFSFLGRATTGIVARAYAANGNDNDDKGDVEAARKAASARTY